MALEIKDLRKSYGDVDALKSLSFTLQPGKAAALLGPNGAGKSTAVKCLVTLIRPDGGTFTYDGDSLFDQPQKIRELVGYVSQELALDKVLTGLEFMKFCAGLLHLDWKTHGDRARELLKKMGLKDAQDRRIEGYSGGMKRRLDLAVALLNSPKVLILDEPTTGLDIEARELVWELVRDFLRKGGSMILASHDFREVEELSDDVLILKSGNVVSYDTPEALKRKLGSYIVRLKTRDYMGEADFKMIRALFEVWGDMVIWYPDEEFATFAYTAEEPVAELQARICKDLDAAGLTVSTLNIQRPSLEDVYRFAVGGEQ